MARIEVGMNVGCEEDFNLLYKTYVRPHFEYCVQTRSPALVNDIEVIEKVQQRATKWIKGLKKLY